MKLLVPFVASVCLLASSCDSPEYLEHKLKTEKTGPCAGETGQYRMISNIQGERYEFTECLPDNFKEEDCNITRQGDTLLVDFPTSGTKNANAYKVTLDIDAQPAYHVISLSGNYLQVVPSE